MTDDMNPEQFYDELASGEWKRLQSNPVGRFEFENTIAALGSHLPDGGTVLDAGGGPGRYSVWLAEHGFHVEHLDVSREQVRLAREHAVDHEVGDRVSCQKGDIRNLPFDDERFDAVCCLGGPLSHVLDADDRETVVNELARVANPGAPVFVSVIGLLNAIRDGIKHGLDHPGVLTEFADSGDYTQDLVEKHDAEGWAECHFFRATELETLLEAAGFDVEKLIGLEGPASTMGPELADASDDAVEAVREVVQTYQTDPAVVDFSEHILAVCWA